MVLQVCCEVETQETYRSSATGTWECSRTSPPAPWSAASPQREASPHSHPCTRERQLRSRAALQPQPPPPEPHSPGGPTLLLSGAGSSQHGASFAEVTHKVITEVEGHGVLVRIQPPVEHHTHQLLQPTSDLHSRSPSGSQNFGGSCILGAVGL